MSFCTSVYYFSMCRPWRRKTNLSRFSIFFFFICEFQPSLKLVSTDGIHLFWSYTIAEVLPFIISLHFGRRDTLGRRDTMRCQSTEFDLIFFGVMEPVFLKFSIHLFMQYPDGGFTFLPSLALNSL